TADPESNLTCLSRTATIITLSASGIPARVAAGTSAMVVLHNDNRPSVKEVTGRIRKAIRVGNRDCWPLFDSGARHSYITRSAAAGLDLQPLLTPRRSMLGGSTHEVTHVCLVQAS